MFHSAYLRLTIWYLTIIMIVSVLFSAVLYRVITDEIDRGLHRQVISFRGPIIQAFQLNNDRVEQLVESELNDSKERIRFNLIVINLFILFIAGGASYYLAKRTLQPIEEAHTSQSRFTADASHELRTPLTAMKAEIEVALREKTISASAAKNLLKSNLEEIDKLEELSNNLLVLSQIQDRDKKNLFKQISLKEIVEQAIADLSPIAQKKKITLQIDLKEIKLQADKESINRTIKILLDNAFKYSPEGSNVSIKTYTEGSWAVIQVTDQGIGIKELDLAHIFDRFYRADTSRSKKDIPGYGLGLSIAKKIIENHQGKIEAISTIDKGSTFTIKLPSKRL